MRLRLIAVSTLLALTTGCANTSSLTTRYVADNGEAPVQNLLLVGRSAELKTRIQWEKACASRLGGGELTITFSHNLWPQEQLPDSEALLAQASAQGFDGVLIADITSLLLLPLQMPPDNVVTEERRFSGDTAGQSSRFGITLGTSTKAAPVMDDPQIEFQLQRPGGKVLWNALVHTHDANQIEAIARSQCQRVRKSLLQSDLLP
jgi:hypothetical protein